MKEKPKVLLVDDNEDTLNLVKMGVKLYNPSFDLDVVNNSQGAIDYINNNSFDAIILDVSLPIVTGSTLGELIRKQNPTVPIAFLTNYNGPQTHNSAGTIGATFWYKPDVLDNLKKFMLLIEDLIKTNPSKSYYKSNVVLPESLSKIIKK